MTSRRVRRTSRRDGARLGVRVGGSWRSDGAGALLAGYDVVVADDSDTPERRRLADDLGVDLLDRPRRPPAGRARRAQRRRCPRARRTRRPPPVQPSPRDHRRRVVSEIELAYEWEQQRDGGPRPMLAITGTDGKTTTTLLTVAILEAAGVRAVAAGNTDVPSSRPSTSTSTPSSSSARASGWRGPSTSAARRRRGSTWRPTTSTGTTSVATYAAAKAQDLRQPTPERRRHRLRRRRRGDAPPGHGARPSRHVRSRRRPTTGSRTGCCVAARRDRRRGLDAPQPPPRRDQRPRRRRPRARDRVGRRLGGRRPPWPRSSGRRTASSSSPRPTAFAWFNDSKATTPHAAAAAIDGFDHVVLIAGGRNKGLDLAPHGRRPRADPRRRRDRRGGGDVAAAFAAAGAAGHDGVVDGRSCRRRRGSCPPRRRRPAVAGLRQLRLVPRGVSRPVATTSATRCSPTSPDERQGSADERSSTRRVRSPAGWRPRSPATSVPRPLRERRQLASAALAGIDRAPPAPPPPGAVRT